jgi:gliding motility-associated-like protein
VYGRDRDGCGVTASDEVSFIDFPPFFTPNGDGYNDTWNITGLGTELNRGAQVFIFDRYGKLLKQLSPSATGWDGTYNGNPLPSGDYWFSVEYLDPAVNNGGTTPKGPVKKTFKNHFTLKR